MANALPIVVLGLIVTVFCMVYFCGKGEEIKASVVGLLMAVAIGTICAIVAGCHG